MGRTIKSLLPLMVFPQIPLHKTYPPCCPWKELALLFFTTAMRNLLLIISFFIPFFAFAQDAKVDETVSVNKIKSHIYFLASDALRGRDTGSPELKIAAEYIVSRFREYGVKPVDSIGYFQKVPFKKITAPIGGIVSTKDLSLAVGDQALLMQGGNGDWEADMVFVGYGDEKSLKKAKLSGKIVVAICGAKDEKNPQKWLSISREKRKRVQEMGGLALVELYNSNQIPWLLLVNYLNNDKVILDDGEGNDEFLSLFKSMRLILKFLKIVSEL